mmetsp:Transcript_21520/g.59620  ORF Transcript_21520/g.59620 Transcript_21520/m.59620 type:complete len:112 (-) Transcript_21520:815-1150(-)|eukprot:CAMPEP_0202338110 /NCGR_PEP_ID=MMETSP1126-20121109/517_1 /ASSEMBLY_ACC=CAM_ASM_000457 /TAXON_ID=3047 /ORGANISM="Dunaliella tertiolecta, Strain CCMP1320" /LENGTH=111 /DNA_ID=CAMNT_0048928423 /DNA_START=636 /DNA_END=971 /DNA_ORIENTATION=+
MSERTCAYFCALRLNKRQTSPTPAGAKRTEFDIKRLLAHRLKPEAKASPESPRFNFLKVEAPIRLLSAASLMFRQARDASSSPGAHVRSNRAMIGPLDKDVTDIAAAASGK